MEIKGKQKCFFFIFFAMEDGGVHIDCYSIYGYSISSRDLLFHYDPRPSQIEIFHITKRKRKSRSRKAKYSVCYEKYTDKKDDFDIFHTLLFRASYFRILLAHAKTL
jgi:hypothetical protein